MRRLVARWRASSESQARFARRHGLSPWTFWYWCRKLDGARPTDAGPVVPPTFVPVRVATEADGPVVELTVNGTTRLQVRAGAPAELVRAIIAALRAPC
jgi:hypothetical protein